jgi:hypothetical protein
MLTKKAEKAEKNRKTFCCETCDFHTSDKKDFTRHCSTRKHQTLTDVNKKPNINEHRICSQCGKQYKSREGLWKHNKVCTLKPSNECTDIIKSNDDIPGNEPIQNYIMKLVEQNNELKNMFIQKNNELHEKIDILSQQQPTQITNIQNNNKTINNTQFNLNVFLNETCKDAINMSEFIDTLQINPESVEYTGIHGYVNGITKIFMDGLNQLDVHERPIHCTDLKRETLYIKEEDKWEKDTEDKTRFKSALDKVVNRNVAQVRHWEDENPRCKIPETEEYEFYFVIARQSLGGGDHTVTARNNDRILRAIAGRVYLDKKTQKLVS